MYQNGSCLLIAALLLHGCSLGQHTVSAEPILITSEREIFAAILDFFSAENIASYPMVTNRARSCNIPSIEADQLVSKGIAVNATGKFFGGSYARFKLAGNEEA